MSVKFISCNDAVPAGRAASSHLPLVFLPGWGFDGRVIELAPAPLSCLVPVGLVDPDSLGDDLIAFLDEAGIAKIRLAGWSMGANLALDFARQHPERVDSLLLFSMRQNWPGPVVAAIRHDLDADPQNFMQSFYRKCFVGDRTLYGRFVENLQESYQALLDRSILHRGLDYLAAARVEPVRAVNDLHLFHGGRDIIAPVAERAELPGAAAEVFDKEGHALFLSPDFVWPECGLATRKKTIRQRFSRAATTYDAHADVQKEVALALAARLPDLAPRRLLEIGCGSGNYTALLAERYPEAEMLALDFAPGMVEAARHRFADYPRLAFACRDGEEFLAEESEQGYDLVTSNATLQWFDDPRNGLVKMARALNDSGTLLCSLFGPQTLGELALGLSEVCGRAVHLPPHRFPALPELRNALAGLLPQVACAEWLVQRQYGSLRELLQHIRKTGTSGWRSGNHPLLTRKRLRELDRWFIARHGGYQVTYQALFVEGRKGGEGHG